MSNSPYQDVLNDKCTVSMMNVDREFEKSLLAYDQAMTRHWEACISYINDTERYVAMAASYCKKAKTCLEVISEHSESLAANGGPDIATAPMPPTVPIVPTAPRRPQALVGPDFTLPDLLISGRDFTQCRAFKQGRASKLRRAIDRMEDECRLILASATSRADKANFQVERLSNNIEALKTVSSDDNSIVAETGPRNIGLFQSM